MRILVADNEAKVRSALRLLLEQQPDLQVVGEVAETASLAATVRALQPDALLIDWELPGQPPAELVEALREMRPTLLIIALSGRSEARKSALRAGADGFVSKVEPPDRVLTVLNRLSAQVPGGGSQF
jgi:DNA-binding NarL/FixJ family response regulator